MRKQIYFLLIGLILSCSVVTRTYQSGGGGGGGGNGGNNNFNLKPTTPSGLLAVFNACDKPIWVQTPVASNGIPETQQLVKVLPHKQYNYNTNQVFSLRLWAKFNCNQSGDNCGIGQEIAPCFTNGGCQPPIDTSFELDTSNPAEAFYDITMVNGFTGPMKVVVFGSNLPSGCNNIQTPEDLSISKICPASEMLNTPTSDWASSLPSGLTSFGNFTTYNNAFGQTIHLDQPQTLLAPSLTNSNTVIGCFSPGQKLVSVPAWGGLGVADCVGSQCQTNNPPDITSTGGTAGAYDSRVVMYQNPYAGCDLTYTSVSGSSSPNCVTEKRTPIQMTTSLATPNNFSDNLVAFCTGAGVGSIYCSDAAAGGIVKPPFKPSTAAANLAKLGPIVKTNYVTSIHNNVPNVYAWQYDDINGLQQCNSSQAKFVVMLGCPVQ